MPYCPACGEQVAERPRVCPSCGAELATGTPGTERESHDTDPSRNRAPGPSDPSRTRGAEGNWLRGRKAALGGAVLGAVGAFLPWITVQILGTTTTKRGIEADGRITLVLCVAVFLLAAWRWTRWTRVISFVLGAVVLLGGLVYINDPFWGVEMTEQQRRFREAVSPGSGLYLTAAAGFLVVAGVVHDSFLSGRS